MENFSATKAFSFGWETFKKRPGFFIWVTFAVFVVSLIVSVLTDKRGFILAVVGFCASSLINMGVSAFFLKAHDDVTKPTFNDLWHPQHFLSYVGAAILVMLAVFVGIILLIVPGVIAAIILGFATLIVIDRGLGPIEALKESKHITDGKRWEMFMFILIGIGINIVGLLVLVVGLLVTIPVTVLAYTHAYRVLAHSAGASHVSSADTPVSAVTSV